MTDTMEPTVGGSGAAGPTQTGRAPLGPSPTRVAALVAAVAVLADLALLTRVGGFAAMTCVAVQAAGLAVFGGVRRPAGRLLLVTAAGVSTCLFLRASPWLVALDLVAIALLLAMACSSDWFARPFDTRIVGMARRVGAVTASLVVGPPRAFVLLVDRLPDRESGSGRVVGSVARGVALAVPVVGGLGLVLAWADPVFASLFHVDADLSTVPVHLLVVGSAVWVAIGLFVHSTRPPVVGTASRMSIGAVEGLVVMASLTAVYAVFAVTRLLVARRGAEFVTESTGLTYAEYARSGFFQLLWVAALTVVVLVRLRSLVRLETRQAQRWFSILGTVAAVLTLVVVHAAVLRLELYQSEFGLTLLRLYSTVFAWWLVMVFVAVGIAFATLRRARRDWLPSVIALAALAAVVLLNVINPDAAVVRHNTDRARGGEELDVPYLMTLSADAVPALVDVLPELSEGDRQSVSQRLCWSPDPESVPDWNAGSHRARSALEELCR